MAEQKIKDVPMLTIDGVSIKLGGTLFVAEVASKYDHESEKRIKTVQINEWKIIHVNKTHRKFKVRHENGSETDYTMAGRVMSEVFGKRSSVLKKAKSEVLKHLRELRKEISDLQKIERLYKTSYQSLKGV